MFVALFAAGCTNSGLGLPPVTGATADTGTAVVTGEPCPWIGDWTLSSVSCGSFPFEGWYVDHESASLALTQAPQGGCEATVTVVGASCSRAERWHLGPPSGLEVDATYEGVVSCDPDACAFSVEEPACKVGGGAGAPETIRVDDTSGNLVIEQIIADTAPGCSLDVLTTWAPG